MLRCLVFPTLAYAAHPTLCAPEVVAQSCRDLNVPAGAEAPTEQMGFVSSDMLERGLSAKPDQVQSLTKLLGLSGTSFSCQGLCDTVVAELKERTTLPPASDLACYRDTELRCDLDVSAEALKQISFTGDLPDPGDDDESVGPRPQLAALPPRLLHYQNESMTARMLPLELAKKDRKEGIEYTEYQMLERLANWFRIYPIPDSASNDGATFTLLAEDASSASRSQCLADASRVNAKTKAYVSTVIRNVQQLQTRDLMYKWFGRTSSATRTEVVRVLNAVEEMLSSVDYVLPGKSCAPNMYGYVFPRYRTCPAGTSEPCTKDSSGRYVIYLCDLYCQSSENVQIETVAHEGAHHGTAFLDDVPPEPYGRHRCEQMAREDPDDAIRNADSFCYYLLDVASGAYAPPAPMEVQAGPGNDTCQYAKDNECDEVQFCAEGTDCSDCGTCDATTSSCPVSPMCSLQTDCFCKTGQRSSVQTNSGDTCYYCKVLDENPDDTDADASSSGDSAPASSTGDLYLGIGGAGAMAVAAAVCWSMRARGRESEEQLHDPLLLT